MTTKKNMKLKLIYSKANPLNIDKHNWIYTTYPTGRTLELIHEVIIDGKWIKTEHIKIPMKKLEKAIEIVKEK